MFGVKYFNLMSVDCEVFIAISEEYTASIIRLEE
jgi:hypothetical protein